MYIKKEDQAATVRQTVMGGKGEILSRIFLDCRCRQAVCGEHNRPGLLHRLPQP